MTWTFDPTSTQVIWSVTHMGLITIRGSFRSIDVRLEGEGDDPAGWSVQVDIDAASLDSWSERRDSAVKRDYLDAAGHPRIHFESRRVEPRPSGELLITGQVTLLDTTREMTLLAHPTGETVDPRGVTRLGFSASTGLRWSDFAPPSTKEPSRWSQSIISDEIGLQIEIELLKEG